MPKIINDLFLSPVNKHFGSNLNLIKIQKYINGVCGIAPHTDKLLDLTPNASIFFFRINKTNKTRSLYFQKKDDLNEIVSYELKSNNLLEITYEENLEYVHYVPKFESNASDECISFVFRNSHTYMNPQTKIWWWGKISNL